MAAYGVTFNFIYTNDVPGNVNGGLRRGFIDQGKLEYNMTVEFEKLMGLVVQHDDVLEAHQFGHRPLNHLSFGPE